MFRIVRLLARPCLGLLALGASGCSSDKSATDLNTAGPPMVEQVFVWEAEVSNSGSRRERLRLGFGDHPDIPTPDQDSIEGDDRVVNHAVSYRGSAKVRIVFDELLLGNSLEEIECSDQSYSRIPVGTDPDDIARCAGADLTRCEAVCIGPSGPIGIKDANGDGAVDPPGLRMIDYGDGELAASLVCDGERMPLIQDPAGDAGNTRRSFYNPSGNQLVPADSGIEGLGPAIILFPSLGLRSGASCTVAFRPEVVDKDGNRVCAPPDGDVARDCAGDGDTSAVQFQVEPFAISSSVPEAGATVAPGTGADQTIRIDFVTDVDPDSLGGVTLATGGADVPIEVVPSTQGIGVVITVPGGYAPDSEYTVTIDTSVTDLLGGGPADPLSLTFNTTSGEPPAADAGPPDAGPPDAG
jgi:hypothetical protein